MSKALSSDSETESACFHLAFVIVISSNSVCAGSGPKYLSTYSPLCLDSVKSIPVLLQGETLDEKCKERSRVVGQLPHNGFGAIIGRGFVNAVVVYRALLFGPQQLEQ